MDAAFFPSLSYGEAALEDILQLFGDDEKGFAFPSPDTVDSPQDLETEILQNDVYPFDFTTLAGDSNLDINPGAQTPEQLFADGNTDIWTSSVNFHQNGRLNFSDTWQLPALDYSISLGMTDAFPSPIMSDSDYPSLDTSLRDELVTIYFENVHPLCPIIDEQNFWWHLGILSEEQFFGLFPSMMFNAMIFAAFAHATDEQANRAGFTSICEAQAEYFQLLTQKYEYARCEVWSEIEEVVLAKTALLLSFWCPPKLDITVNSLWVDRAIHHTKQFFRKSSSKTNMLLPKRCDILYWSCMSRNTFISFVMRRPYRLHIEEEPLCDPDAVRSEFEREISFHSSSSPVGKLRMVEDFVVLCKLSQCLNSILRSQRSMLFEVQWKPSQINTIENTDMELEEEDNELHEYLSRYLEAAKYESELLELIEEHGKNSSLDMDNDGTESTSGEMLAKLRSYTLSIITYSSIASLYQFTLSTTSGSWAKSCHRTAFSKLSDASAKVSLEVGRLLANATVEAIPGTILSWAVAPMITFLVERNCGNFGLSQFSNDHEYIEQNNNTEEFETQKIGNLIQLMHTLAPRFKSARDVWHLMLNMDQILRCDDVVSGNAAKSQNLSSVSKSTTTKNGQKSFDPEERQAMHLDVLKRGMRFVDHEIAYLNT